MCYQTVLHNSRVYSNQVNDQQECKMWCLGCNWQSMELFIGHCFQCPMELTTQIIYVTIIWEMYLTILYHIQSIIIALSLWIWKIALYVFANPTTKTPKYQIPLRNTFEPDRYCGVKKKKNQMKYDIITILMFYYLNIKWIFNK